MEISFVIILIFAISAQANAASGRFGESCDVNDFDSCDIGSALSCGASTCECLYPWMIYDPIKTKCVSTVSSPCDLDSNNKFLDCVGNAYCVSLPNEFGQPFPQCMCNNSFVAMAKKRCSDRYEQISYYGEQLSQICCPRY